MILGCDSSTRNPRAHARRNRRRHVSPRHRSHRRPLGRHRPTRRPIPRSEHVYADDLDLFGRGCLFELLSTARLPMGENQLAAWLQTPRTRSEILERQKLVAELRDKLDLAARSRRHRRRSSRPPQSRIPSRMGRSKTRNARRRLARRRDSPCAVANRRSRGRLLHLSMYWPLLASSSSKSFPSRRSSIAHTTSTKASPATQKASSSSPIFCNALNAKHSRLPRLAILSQPNSNATASPHRTPSGSSPSIEYWIDAHHSLIGHLVELPLLYSIQTAFVAESWRHRHGARMRSSRRNRRRNRSAALASHLFL